MSNPTLDLIHAHGSVRAYKTDPLPDALIETIVAAAQRASSSSNLQAYSVLAITDAAKRARLAELCGKQIFIAQAPLFLAWCADLARLDRVCALRGFTQVTEYLENFLIGALDVGITAQNAALAAESLGLGICYVGSIRNSPREVIELLGLPRLVFPVVGMTIGYPERAPTIRPRLPLNAILHRERYNADQDRALREYDRTMAATGIYEHRQVPVPGRPGEMEEYGWLEHCARRVSQVTRAFMREVLREQGFALK
ncbi:MAG: NADPH-dependent oxidoreductase [Chloroflexi bacterium]|nr:NADPH-dependent oxidoreductase [Chloroflexota bacterium]